MLDCDCWDSGMLQRVRVTDGPGKLFLRSAEDHMLDRLDLIGATSDRIEANGLM